MWEKIFYTIMLVLIFCLGYNYGYYKALINFLNGKYDK